MPQDAGEVIIISDLLTLIFPIGPRSDHCLTLFSVCQSLVIQMMALKQVNVISRSKKCQFGNFPSKIKILRNAIESG